ncbi:FxLYD domain-containing protein [Flavobacterium sp. LB3P45]|uniref:FxLYD domain-containing protein n=1 Tax=Flavobacterium fructosi TaxID=3230416 RepID=A0ABW6HPI1_9FLAO
MKVLKWIGIVIVGIIVLGLLLPDSDKKTEGKAEVAETSKEDIEVVKSSETNTEMMRTVHVEVKNNTDKLLNSGQIKVIYEDAKGNIVGTGLGTILNLASGASKVVDCLAMDVVGASTYRTEVTPLMYE